MQFIQNLCAIQWTAYLLDFLVILFVLGFTVVCARKGFVECFFGFISTIIAIIVAFSLAKVLVSVTRGLFGLQGVFEKSFTKAFSKISGFDADVSAMGAKEALREKDLPAVLASLVISAFGKKDLPIGTTIGSMLGVSVAKFAVVLLCGILLFILTKILVSLLKTILTKIISKITILSKVDSLLGAIVGVIESILAVCLVLSIMTIIPSQAVSNYLDGSLFVGALYNYNPLVHMLFWLL